MIVYIDFEVLKLIVKLIELIFYRISEKIKKDKKKRRFNLTN